MNPRLVLSDLDTETLVGALIAVAWWGSTV